MTVKTCRTRPDGKRMLERLFQRWAPLLRRRIGVVGLKDGG